MRLHTCAITASDLHDAARLAGVTFDTMTEHGSRAQHHAWNVKLFGSSGRRPNWGTSGVGSYGVGDGEAATWDEWGIFLAALYRLDPLMKTPYYDNADHYHWVTGRRFVSLTHAEQHRVHKWGMGEPHYSGLFSEVTCIGTKGPSNPGCGAIRRWLIHGHKFAEIAGRVRV